MMGTMQRASYNDYRLFSPIIIFKILFYRTINTYNNIKREPLIMNLFFVCLPILKGSFMTSGLNKSRNA